MNVARTVDKRAIVQGFISTTEKGKKDHKMITSHLTLRTCIECDLSHTTANLNRVQLSQMRSIKVLLEGRERMIVHYPNWFMDFRRDPGQGSL